MDAELHRVNMKSTKQTKIPYKTAIDKILCVMFFFLITYEWFKLEDFEYLDTSRSKLSFHPLRKHVPTGDVM